MDTVTVKRQGKEFPVVGRVLIEALDGGILLQSRDGTLWTIKPEEVGSKSSDDKPFKTLHSRGVQRLRSEATAERIHRPRHGPLSHLPQHLAELRQLVRVPLRAALRGIQQLLERKGLDLSEPEFPLAAVVFKDRKSYVDYAEAELGDAVHAVVGFYSLRSNRMTMFDLSGKGQFAGDRGARAAINQLLMQPQAFKTVSTIVHEATHQIAFNRGMHQRYADCPLWFVEVSPFSSKPPTSKAPAGGAPSAASINSASPTSRTTPEPAPPIPLRTLIQNDTRCRNPKTAIASYGEAWALTYYLIRQHPKEYIKYVKMLGQKKPMRFGKDEDRIKEFEDHFGKLEDVEEEFMRYMQRL